MHTERANISFKHAILVFLSVFLTGQAIAEDQENASDPLAKVRNTDVKLRTFDIDSNDRDDYAIEGAMMLTPDLKLRYEVRYWETDVTGRDTSGLESARAKAIYFLGDGIWGSTPYRLAVGAEAKIDFDNQDKGIGQDANTLLPFIGVALKLRPTTTVIPLLQHEEKIEGTDVSVSSLRILALQQLPNKTWLKVDALASVNWEDDNNTPAAIELQYGHQFNSMFGLYAEVMSGIGGHKTYDWGVGVGMRFNY